MECTIKNSSSTIYPRKNDIDFCYEIFSPVDEKIPPLQIKLIFTGFNLNCPTLNNYYVKLESKPDEENYIDVLGGIIDKDYTGDIGIIIYNFSHTNEKIIKRGDIIAVARLLKYDNNSKEIKSNNNNILLPKKMTEGSVAFDIYTPRAGIINENSIITISTGIKIPHHNIRYASRSGLASKSLIIVIHGDENGKFILLNLSNNRKYKFQRGDRICQIIYEM